MSDKRVPYRAFGKTKLVPLRVYVDGKPSEQEWFQNSIWIERNEDWYSLRNPPTLVVERNDFLNAPDYDER